MSSAPTPLQAVLADLAAEGDALDTHLADIGPEDWRRETPAEGWDIATSIAHLAWTDEVALLALGAHTPEGKEAWDAVVLEAIEDPTGFVDAVALTRGAVTPADRLVVPWRQGRARLAEALATHPAGTKIPWFGPPMSPTSMATARFMETWAHGLDVVETLGRTPERSDRVRHVCHIGVRTRGYSFVNNGLEVPAAEVRVDLVAPSGDVWTWGPDDAAETVTGQAWEFAELVTQRIHRDDTTLQAVGAGAEQWLRIAQAFAGPPGGGRPPRAEGEHR